jgi:predicted ATP-binding protein involved in virulence
MSKSSRSIRQLDNNARKGNIAASFQLFENYSKGVDVDIDFVRSEQYLNQCASALAFNTESDIERPINKIGIDEINLFYFRKFRNLKITFEKDLTVFIGDNGAGKTTILDAISRTFSWINARIIVQGRNGRPLDDSDITIDSYENSEVISTISLGKHTLYKGSLVRAAKGIETSKSSFLDNYRNLSNLFRVVNDRTRRIEGSEINIPLFAYYSVERSNLKSNTTFDLEKVSEGAGESRFDALDKTVLDGTGNITDFLRWFIYMDNLSNSSEVDRLKKMKLETEALEQVVKDTSHPLYSLLTEKKEDIFRLEKKISQSNSEEYNSTVNSVKKAIVNAVSSVSDIFIDRSSGRAEVRLINEGVNINFFQASKGQQVYISLIADIARRLTLLNPNLENRLSGQGIILIDEIELHLHPEWQKNVIRKLMTTFPNIQFIITTHSPVVLSGIRSNKIRALGKDINGTDTLAHPLAESYARSPSEVLHAVMHVDPAQNIPEMSKLRKYRNIIEQGDINSKEADDLRAELEKALGSTHEELIRLSLVKKRRAKLG